MAARAMVLSQSNRVAAASVGTSEGPVVYCPFKSQLLAFLKSVTCLHYK